MGRDHHRTAVVADVPDRFRERLDLLFVVDNTEGAAGLQSQVASLFSEVFEYASLTDTGRLDLHVGLVSSDLGTGSVAVPGCSADGDGGVLRRAPTSDQCAGILDRWIEVRRDGDTVEGNIPGLDEPEGLEAALQRAMACFAEMTASTCGYPQPLAAIERALSPDQAANRGFLRDDAALGVVLLAGEDDCSATPAFFAAGDDSAESPRFRCFDRGVACDGDDVRVVPGPQTGCKPAVGPQLVDVAAPAETLTRLRPADALVVTGAVGDVAAIDVVEDSEGTRALAPACQRTEATLYPSVRLSGFVQQFGHGAVAPMCADGAQAAAAPTGRGVRTALGHRCLTEVLLDADPETPGLQWDCTVTAVAADDTRTTLPACDHPESPASSPGPCFAIRPGPCPDFPTGLAVIVNWGGATPSDAPLGVRTEVACLVEE